MPGLRNVLHASHESLTLLCQVWQRMQGDWSSGPPCVVVGGVSGLTSSRKSLEDCRQIVWLWSRQIVWLWSGKTGGQCFVYSNNSISVPALARMARESCATDGRMLTVLYV